MIILVQKQMIILVQKQMIILDNNNSDTKLYTYPLKIFQCHQIILILMTKILN
jgi:hypothetical protein